MPTNIPLSQASEDLATLIAWVAESSDGGTRMVHIGHSDSLRWVIRVQEATLATITWDFTSHGDSLIQAAHRCLRAIRIHQDQCVTCGEAALACDCDGGPHNG